MRGNRLVLVVCILVALAGGFLAGRSRITVEEEKTAEPQPAQEELAEEHDPGYYPPPAVVHSVKPEYPENAKEEGIQGTAFVRVLVDTTGCASEVEVFRSVHPALDSAAVFAARQWRFKPHETGHGPIPQYVVIPVKFALD
jgi:TonB family protein